YQKGTVLDPSHQTVRTDDAIEFLHGFRSRLPQERNETVSVLRVHALLQPIVILIEGCGATAPDFLEGGADVKDLVCAKIKHPKDLIDVFRQLPKALFALQISDVDIRADITGENAVRREARNAATQHPSILSVCPTQPALYAKFPACVK